MKTDISIIICTFNRPESLAEALDSLYDQERTKDFSYEIIVVDNNSNEETQQAIMKLLDKSQNKFKYVRETRQGINFARNRGLHEAQGELVAYTDDDVIVNNDWIANIWKCYQATHFDAMGGKVMPQYPVDTPKWIIANHDILRGPVVKHDYGNETKPYDATMISFIGASMVYQRAVLKEVGSFNTDLGPGSGTFGDDTELYFKLRSIGKKIYYCGQALSWHPVIKSRMTLQYFAKWNIYSGRFHTYMDYGQFEHKPYRNVLGVPLFVIKYILRSIGLMLVNIFNRREFLRHWCRLFLEIGKAIEFRKRYKDREGSKVS